MKAVKDLIGRIESAIQARAHEQAHRLIQGFLRAGKHAPDARLAASEYYRRLSDYGKALRVLKLDVHPSGWKKTGEKTGGKASETDTEIQLQAVRVLNLLGASSYALRIIEKLPRVWREKHGLRIAPVLMANYRYDEALKYLEPLLGMKDADLDYPGRLKLLSLSDCYCGLKRFDEARSVAERMRKEIELADPIVLSRSAAPAKLGPVHFDLLSDVKTVEREGSAADAPGARHELGLSVSDRLHALLICSGPYGVPQFRAYEYLWPDAVLAFHQHQKRLEQAVSRLRSEKAEVSWRDFHLRLGEGDRTTCLWSSRAPVPGLVFLESRREFRRGDVEWFFSVSKRSANELLQRWEKSDLVASEGKGPSRRYRSRVKAESST